MPDRAALIKESAEKLARIRDAAQKTAADIQAEDARQREREARARELQYPKQ